MKLCLTILAALILLFSFTGCQPEPVETVPTGAPAVSTELPTETTLPTETEPPTETTLSTEPTENNRQNMTDLH